MKQYEITYLISPDLSPEQAKEIADKIIGILQEKHGILGKTKPVSMQKLGYPMKAPGAKAGKQAEKYSCFVGSASFNLEPANIGEIKQKISLLENLFRFIIVLKKERKITTRTREAVFKKAGKKEKEPKTKVELKEIEQKLEELLGE